MTKRLLLNFAYSELKARYLGSYFGLVWALVHPLAVIAVFWFVFEVGFKVAAVSEVPFILWFMAGFIPWFFFSESLSLMLNVVPENSFLVKKVHFNVTWLPLVRLLSSLPVNAFLFLLLLAMYALYGRAPSLQWLQLLYYLAGLGVLLTGLGYFVAAAVVFFKDTVQIVQIVLQFGFWLTPIFWSPQMVPETYHWLIGLNPMYYIVDGFRESLTGGAWFWERPLLSLYFWGITLAIFAGGVRLFRRLKPHFADVL